jgi:hypothetical protein
MKESDNPTVYINKPIKAVGNKRRKEESVSRVDDDLPLIEESLNIMDKETFQRIKDDAEKNPITKELIETGKTFFKDNKAEIEEQIRDIVALYSVKTKKPFFFITPQEARVAIDYIKGWREDRNFEKNIENEQDAFVNKFKKDKNKEFILLTDKELQHSLQQDKDTKEILYHILNFNENYNFEINSLNKMFAKIEIRDMIVAFMICNAVTYSKIRNWGHSVFEEYNRRDIVKRKCYGRIWTSEIYTDNELKDNQVVLGSLRTYGKESNTKPEGWIFNFLLNE